MKRVSGSFAFTGCGSSVKVLRLASRPTTTNTGCAVEWRTLWIASVARLTAITAAMPHWAKVAQTGRGGRTAEGGRRKFSSMAGSAIVASMRQGRRRFVAGQGVDAAGEARLEFVHERGELRLAEQAGLEPRAPGVVELVEDVEGGGFLE